MVVADFPMKDMPSNLTVRPELFPVDLRQLYDHASVVVGPLEPGLKSAAGANGVLEALAIRKPLILSATLGIAEYVDDGEIALVVPPHDPLTLGAAITRPLTDQGAASGLANAGHALVASGRNLDGYGTI
ncbi:MAG TPA: glycosyltransferase [Chloroflexota bacterium]|nr:glycosyltransferase [Chloroflexota bacterium]